MTAPVGRRRGRPPLTDSSRADERRRQIVAEAAALFDTEGFSSTTMERIAESVGLAKSSLYHYFRSRDDVLYAIHDEFIDLLNEAHEHRLREDGWTTDELLEAVMTDVLRLMETHRGHVRVFFEHHRELPPAGKAAIRAKRDKYYTAVWSLIAQGTDAGDYDVDPRLAALALFGMCNWAYQWFDASGTLSPEDVAHQFWQILSRGIRARRS